MFSKILVSYDGSEQSANAVSKAAELAVLCNAKVTILRAIETETEEDAGFGVAARWSGMVVDDQGESTGDEFRRKIVEDDIMTNTSELTKAAADAGIEITYAAIVGDPKTAISAFAVGGHYDLIVMGHRSLSGFSSMVGSVSQRVAKDVDIPILLVR